MEFLDLFSGIGGFRRGLERSGHRCIGHVEIDKYANISYMAMYGLSYCKYGKCGEGNCCRICSKEVNEHCDGSKCTGEWFAKDIKQLTAGEIPRAEIWTFGFPCTDISLSGKRAGLAGERSGLFFTVAGLLKSTPAEDKPRILIVENVKHLLSCERGGDFTAVLFNLWEAGYDLEWQCVNSKDFGVPQHRERVYLVGHLGGIRGRKVFPIGGANQTPVKQLIGGKQGKRVYDISGVSVTMTAQGGGFAGRTGLYTVSISRKIGLGEAIKHAHTLTASDARGLNRNQEQNAILVERRTYACFIDMNENPSLTEHARCINTGTNRGIVKHRGETSGVFLCQGNPACIRAVLTPERIHKRQNGRRFKEPGEPQFTLTTQDRHGVLLCCCENWRKGLPIKEAKKEGYTIAYPGDGINLSFPNSKVSRGRVGRQVSQTLMTGGQMGVYLCCRIRRLTPRECFRLQAFEDFLFDRAKEAGVSDAQLYKQAGNSVTVNIVYEIGLRLAEMEASILEV